VTERGGEPTFHFHFNVWWYIHQSRVLANR